MGIRRNPIISQVTGLQSIWDFIDEMSSYSHSPQSKSFTHVWMPFLAYRFIPQMVLLSLIYTLLSCLEYVGPISLDLLTQRFYQVNEQQVRGQPSDYLQDLFDSYVLSSFQAYDPRLSSIVILSLVLIVSNILRDIVRMQVESMQRNLLTTVNIFLQNVIYDKSMRLYTNIANLRGQQQETKVLTFHNMLGVIDKIEAGIERFLQIIQVSVELLIGFYYLYSMVEKVAVYSLSSAVLVSLLAIASAGVIQIFVFKLRTYSDARLKLVEDIMNGFKQIKYLGWESFFEKAVQDIRDKEFDQVKGIEYGDSFINFFRRITQSVLLFVTLSNISNIGSINIFTALVLFDKFVHPLNVMPWALGTLAGSLFQLKRIKDYMDQMEIPPSSSSSSCALGKEKIEDEMKTKVAVKCSAQRVYWPHQNYFFKYKFFKQFINVKEDDKITVFKDVNIELPRGSLTAIIGKVGAGKTAFFDLLLNELDATHSSVTINGKIAYVAQNNWLANDTVRQNILFGKTYDEQLYKKCVTLAQLDHDLSTFKEHDSYRNPIILSNSLYNFDSYFNHQVVGFNGGNLSGGQKTRIAICRALYSDNDIFLFDDIFSSIDENVTSLIFSHAILSYLIQERQKTVIISLNQFQYLPLVDKVLSIDDLLISDITTRFSSKQPSTLLSSQISSTSTVVETPQTTTPPPKSAQPEEKTPATFASHKQNWVFYIKRMGVQVLIIFLVSTVLHQGCQGVLEYWSHRFIQSLAHGGSSSSSNNAIQPLFLFGSFKQTLGLIFGVLSLLNILRSAMYAYAELTSARAIFKDVLRSTMYSTMKFLDSKPAPIGFIVDRLFHDMSFLDCLPINFFFIVFFNAAQIIFILLSEFNSMATVIVLSVVLLRKIIQNEDKSKEALLEQVNLHVPKPINDRTSFIVETFNGLKSIRAFGKQADTKRRFLEIQRFKYSQSYAICQSKILPFYLSKLVDYLAISIVCTRAIYQIIYDKEHFDPAPVCMALAYSYRMIGIIEFTIRASADITRTEEVIETVRKFCEQPCEFEGDINHTRDESTTSVAKQQLKGDAAIVFKDVSLHYLDNPTPALKSLSFTIPRGSKVAFCGRTGSGKTSIINCISRLYEIQSGLITLNGVNIADMSVSSVRQNFSVIPQNGFLFNGSLRANIDPLQRFSESQVESFIQSTSLRLDRFANSKSNETNNNGSTSKSMLDFRIEKAGKNLSNGEKQIVNFLQSIIQQKEIILLDEATSNMDPQTDASIIKLLLSKIALDKTLILISHRLDNLIDFDKIFVLDNGQIVESGTYESLSSNPKSHFSSVLKYKQ